MRVWFDEDDVVLDYEDWKEIDFYTVSWMDAPTDILTGRTLQLDLTTDETKPEFIAWQETIRRE